MDYVFLNRWYVEQYAFKEIIKYCSHLSVEFFLAQESVEFLTR